jgi:general secretion pathway protein I
MIDLRTLSAIACHAGARCLSAWHARSARPRRVEKAESSDRSPSQEGFSLVELLVALAVFSLAALALLNLTGENTRSAARVETRTLGGVVAENLAVETMIAPSIAEGTASGRTALAGRDWRWTRTVVATDDPDLLRIDIRVATDEGQAADRTVFRSRTKP